MYRHQDVTEHLQYLVYFFELQIQLSLFYLADNGQSNTNYMQLNIK